MIKGKPFVKWAGGKRQIIDKLKKYIPDMSEETINRRASTIRGRIQWIIGVQI